VQYHLQQLMELGYVARRFPLTGGRPSKKSVRYALEDPLLRFWFRFIYPTRSLLAQEPPKRSFYHRIQPQLDAYFGGCFERLCREALPQLYLRAGMGAPFEVGEFWSRDTQIDVVGVRQDGWTDLGECKWGTVRSPRSVIEELSRKARSFPNKRNAIIGLLLFTRSRVKAAGGAATCYSLEDLYRKRWSADRRRG
jgi:AAA+ ATPase superfamily predicted ATPase